LLISAVGFNPMFCLRCWLQCWFQC
jgi:hypothetical protein